MATYIDRYNSFKGNAEMKPVIGVKLEPSDNDLTYVYKQGTTRLDKLSNMFYNNPYSGWLIMLVNQEYGGLEFNIPDMSIIRIPYPFDSAVERYATAVRKHKLLYGE